MGHDLEELRNYLKTPAHFLLENLDLSRVVYGSVLGLHEPPQMVFLVQSLVKACESLYLWTQSYGNNQDEEDYCKYKNRPRKHPEQQGTLEHIQRVNRKVFSNLSSLVSRDFQRESNILSSFLFLKYISLIMLLQLSFFSPLSPPYSPPPGTSIPSSIPPLPPLRERILKAAREKELPTKHSLF